ncbi:TonB-dependent receptor [Chlorobium limicola DSM 245]|uniref:TonB-dependent receptor n=1 Tax=Chlorobium limicola (strain DSM 245 / NBRC 103803 / 6330) TaxID=290315 RepID=B3EGR4_CHLL2|nr:TonB-dependent receptor [Chlorobium limicola]ACD91177.1 TonB-dependent receptor [Chlorobium limicola DSM 245]
MKTKNAQAYPLVRFVLSAFCLLALLVPLPSYGADTGSVKGKIIDKADGEGVYGASVTVAGTTIGTATDMNGNFTISGVPAKQQKISVSIVGYAPASQVVSVGAGQTAVVNLSLGQTTIMASEVVVGAALYKQDRLDVPTTTNVVSKEKIREEPNPSLDKNLETVPGVNINRSSGYSASTVQIRGSNTFQGGGIGTRVAAFYDGIPLSTPETGGIVWTNINMNSADKIEVVKGASTTLYGSGAMGGVVSVAGHLPDKFEVKAGASAGFYDKTPAEDQSAYRDGYTPWLWNTYVGIGNKSGKWNYSLLYSHSEDDGYRENSQTLLNDVKLKARYDIDATQYLQLSASYSETEAGYVSTWPYDIVGSGTFVAKPQFAYDLADSVYADDIVKRKDILAGLTYSNMLSDKLTLEARMYYTYNKYRIDYNPTSVTQLYPYLYPGSIYNGFIYNRDPGEFNENRSSRYGAGVKLDWRVADSHRLLFGVDGNIVDVESTQYTSGLPVAGEFGSIQEKNAAVFVQDEWKITDRLTALLSLRYDWSGIDADEVTFRDYSVTPGNNNDGPILTQSIENPSVDAISPRIALNYKAMDDMSFRASWGKSFRAPTLAERFVRDAGLFMGNPNPALDKETMTGWEVGVYKQFGDKLSLDISAYLNDYDNLIESRNLNTATGFPVVFEYQNIAKARIWGIETSLNYRPNNHWNFSLGYAYMNAKDKTGDAASLAGNDNPDPEWLAYRPEHTGSASVNWKANDDLTLNLTGRYVGKYKAVSTYPNPEGDNYPGDFVVFNLGMKYQLTENISTTLLCKNIGNVQYEEAEWFRAPGRSFVLGVDLTY